MPRDVFGDRFANERRRRTLPELGDPLQFAVIVPIQIQRRLLHMVTIYESIMAGQIPSSWRVPMTGSLFFPQRQNRIDATVGSYGVTYTTMKFAIIPMSSCSSLWQWSR